MPPSRLSALFDTPSSPLAPQPSDPQSENGAVLEGNTTSPLGSPSRQSESPSTPTTRGRHSSSPYLTQGRRDRHECTEDLSQVGALVARKKQLKPTSVLALEDFCKLPGAGRADIFLYGELLKISEMQALTAPTGDSFTISKKLDHKIDSHAFRTLMSPNLGFYVKKSGADSPTGIVKCLVIDHNSHWGITSDQIQDQSIWNIVSSRIRTRLTDHRYNIKKVLSNSVWLSVKNEEGDACPVEREDPLDIITLCEELVGILPGADVKVTLPMLGRVAILRQILIDVVGGAKFWDKVDEQLGQLREETDEAKVSKKVGKVLKNDCRRYGSPDLSVFN